jgi:hypothetical protein
MFFAHKILGKKSFLNNFWRSVEKSAKMSRKFKLNILNKKKEKVWKKRFVKEIFILLNE